MKSKINIGTSGCRINKNRYAEVFSCVEIQQVFYQPPQIKTLARWCAEVPAEFEFVVKAWQLMTHEARSPTYKRLKNILTETERDEAGRFQPTTFVPKF